VSKPRFLIAGEAAVVVEYGETIDPKINDRVVALDAALAAKPIDGIIETVPTYRSLMIHFDPRRLTTQALIDAVAALEVAAPPRRAAPKRWIVPACYELPHAEDLAEAAGLLGMSTDRVRDLHATTIYRVYMYGFSPGFTFLGGLPDELFLSRRPAPRAPAPTGSLLVANGQALITSFVMPTGWYCLGRTPAKTFDAAREKSFLIDIGDEVTFEPIDAATFDVLAAEAEGGAPVARLAA
jgi:KipI family sensor histidine kinase inhibitor